MLPAISPSADSSARAVATGAPNISNAVIVPVTAVPALPPTWRVYFENRSEIAADTRKKRSRLDQLSVRDQLHVVQGQVDAGAALLRPAVHGHGRLQLQLEPDNLRAQ